MAGFLFHDAEQGNMRPKPTGAGHEAYRSNVPARPFPTTVQMTTRDIPAGLILFSENPASGRNTRRDTL